MFLLIQVELVHYVFNGKSCAGLIELVFYRGI
jgi:hypothetical protein